MLIKGFTMIKNRVDAIEKATQRGSGEAANKLFSIDRHSWLDDLVQRRFGGKRDGLRIRWDISEGTFFYDPFTRSLTQAA